MPRTNKNGGIVWSLYIVVDNLVAGLNDHVAILKVLSSSTYY
jgi:hypothetical protein